MQRRGLPKLIVREVAERPGCCLLLAQTPCSLQLALSCLCPGPCRAARTSGVNAGESLGPSQVSQQVSGLVALPGKRRIDTLTPKRSVVQVHVALSSA